MEGRSEILHWFLEFIKYIFEQFVATYFDEDLKDFTKEWASIQTSLNHRSFNERSENHQAFLKKLLGDLMNISGRVDVGEEVHVVRTALSVV